MSALNRETMRDLTRWKQQAEGAPDGLLLKMQIDTGKCLEELLQCEAFLRNDSQMEEEEGQGEADMAVVE